MEAYEDTEELPTTTDTENIPAKDPSAEGPQEPPTSEELSEPPISETPLEPPASETPTVPPTSQTVSETDTPKTLKPSTSEAPSESLASETDIVPPTSQTVSETDTPKTLKPSISEAPSEPLASETPTVPPTSQTVSETDTPKTLKPFTTEVPSEPLASEPQTALETHTSKILAALSYETPVGSPVSPAPSETTIYLIPDVDPITQTSPSGHMSPSSLAGPKEDLTLSSPSGVIRTKRSIQILGIGFFREPSLPGIPPQDRPYASSQQGIERGEDEKGVDVMDNIVSATQPEHQLGKKKGKKGVDRHTIHTVAPDNQAEVVAKIKARHREAGGAQVNLFQWEKDTSLNAIQTGVYIGWRCPHYLWDCFQIVHDSKCFCGHLMKDHRIISDLAVPCKVSQCRCHMFCFIPSHPEEVGEFWLKRRSTFDPNTWRAQCRCKHSHEDHAATGSHGCKVRDCFCSYFESNFLCAACDRRWEEHETFFETKETRRRGGRPRGLDTVSTWYKPL